MLLYSCLYLPVMKISLNNIKNFRQLHNPTAGHPQNYACTPGIKPQQDLYTRITKCCWISISRKILSEKFSKDLINHFTYVFAGDGLAVKDLVMKHVA